MRAVIVFLLAMSISIGIEAAQNEGCPEHPATLAAMRDCDRPLLIFSPSSSDVHLARQLQELNAHPSVLRERDVRVVVLTADNTRLASTILQGIPATLLNESEQEKIRTQFHISPDHFTVLLIGKDGGEKMLRNAFVSVQELSRKIDSMPMRQLEMTQRPH
jgi:hypothetical protein